MSLMSFGFTKSKPNKIIDDENQGNDNERQEQEAEMVSSSKKTEGSKSSSKSPPKQKSPLKSDNKEKKSTKSSSPKSSSPISSSSKSSSPKSSPPKSTPTKSSPTKSSPTKSTPTKSTPPKSNSKVSPSKISPQNGSKSKNSNNSVQKTPEDDASSPKIKKVEVLSQATKRSPEGSSNNSLPYQRIKMIMKSCPDVEIVPQESLHVITKATELFIQHLAAESVKYNGFTSLDYESLSNVVHREGSLEFLKETVPRKITWAECQRLIAANAANRDDCI